MTGLEIAALIGAVAGTVGAFRKPKQPDVLGGTTVGVAPGSSNIPVMPIQGSEVEMSGDFGTLDDLESGGDLEAELLRKILEGQQVQTAAEGKELKAIPEGNKGLAKLPEEVRNKMGFMANGGGIMSYLNSAMVLDDLGVNAKDLLSGYGKEVQSLQIKDLLTPVLLERLTGEDASSLGDIAGIIKNLSPLMELLQKREPEDRRRKMGSIVPKPGIVGLEPMYAADGMPFMKNFMPNGGKISGPGGPKDDLVPVMASDGEFMLSNAAVKNAGGGNHKKGIANLKKFNAQGNRRYG